MGHDLAGRHPSRRTLLKASALLGAGGLLPVAWARGALAQGGPALAYSINTLSSPSQSQQVRGGKAYARSVGQELNTLLTGGNSDKGIADIRAVLAKFGGNVALMVDPLDSPDARVIVEECERAGAHVVTIWNKPDDLHPWDHGASYVAHVSFDGIDSGRATAQALFAAMGGEGGIVALGGIANNVPAIDRKAGLERAVEASGGKVKLLDFQIGDWASAKGFSITQAWLTQHGDEVKGIWAANDEMALGAIQALSAEGLNGQVKVCSIDGTPPALDAVEKGDLVCTSDWDPYLWGGLGLSLARRAATGTYDPTREGKERREFYGRTALVDASNVKEVKAAKAGSPAVDHDKIWDHVQGRIRS